MDEGSDAPSRAPRSPQAHDSACYLELDIQEPGEMRIQGKMSYSSLAYIASIEPTTPHSVCQTNVIVRSYVNQRQMALDRSPLPICSYSGELHAYNGFILTDVQQGGRATVHFHHNGTWIQLFEGTAHERRQETVLRSPNGLNAHPEFAAFQQHNASLQAHVVTPWSKTHTTSPEIHLHIASDCLIDALSILRLLMPISEAADPLPASLDAIRAARRRYHDDYDKRSVEDVVTPEPATAAATDASRSEPVENPCSIPSGHDIRAARLSYFERNNYSRGGSNTATNISATSTTRVEVRQSDANRIKEPSKITSVPQSAYVLVEEDNGTKDTADRAGGEPQSPDTPDGSHSGLCVRRTAAGGTQIIRSPDQTQMSNVKAGRGSFQIIGSFTDKELARIIRTLK